MREQSKRISACRQQLARALKSERVRARKCARALQRHCTAPTRNLERTLKQYLELAARFEQSASARRKAEARLSLAQEMDKHVSR